MQFKRPTEPEHQQAHHERWTRRLRSPLLFAALLVIPVVIIEASVTSHGLHTAARSVNWAIWAIFVAEFAYLGYLAPQRRHWMLQHWYDVVLILTTIPFLPLALQSLRVLELLTVVEFALILEMARTVFGLQGVKFAAIITSLVVFAGGIAFSLVENGHHGSSNISIWDGIWWAIVTITTVGYGDYYPVTILGRLIGVCVMLSGIGFLAVITTSVANHFIVKNVQHHLADHAEVMKAAFAEHLAQHTETMRAVLAEHWDHPPEPHAEPLSSGPSTTSSTAEATAAQASDPAAVAGGSDPHPELLRRLAEMTNKIDQLSAQMAPDQSPPAN